MLHRKKRNKLGAGAFWGLSIVLLAAAWLYVHATASKPTGLARDLGARYSIVSLSGARVVPVLAQGDRRSEGFASMIQRLRPLAAITGTYFDVERNPIGDLLADGQLIARGHQRQGVGFRTDGKIVFRERKAGKRIDWAGCYAGIACGPRLVRAGKKSVNVRQDGFSESAAILKARRTAVGATHDSRLILCVVPQEITLDKLADLMIELGAVDAVNMDGGSMCALYADRTYHAEPVSGMNNILAVFKAPKKK